MVAPTISATAVRFVDNYCAAYQEIFPDVRSYECFQYFYVGIMSEIQRKSLPAIISAVLYITLSNNVIAFHPRKLVFTY